jgi:hypothetical protein
VRLIAAALLFAFSSCSANADDSANRVELGDFDALVLGLLLMSHFDGQLVVPDFGFYGRDIHSRLIREERLIAEVNTLNELPPKLRQMALLIRDKQAAGATVEDAEELTRYERLPRGTNGFLDFVCEGYRLIRLTGGLTSETKPPAGAEA